ncbi:hypothetical protein [Streptomyces sp. NPDC002328]|uniref:hypothetical protein n=1 Tax=Streptomyces sp. NPDC002328 TaxID=3364642 RepID=UPI00369DDBA5
MSNVSDGVPVASGKSEIFEFFLRFMPEWVQITVIALVVLAVVASWILKLKRKIAYRRAVRSGVAVHAAAQHGQGWGADYLGAYAPQNQGAPASQGAAPQASAPQGAAAGQPSGADFLGPYAPQNRQAPASQGAAPQASAPQGAAAGQPSGADFLGAYAPQQGRDGSR